MNTCKITKSDNSVLYKHIIFKHSGSNKEPVFTAKVTGLFKDALTRQVAEAVKINDTPPPKLINSKAEFGHNKMTRIQLITE